MGGGSLVGWCDLKSREEQIVMSHVNKSCQVFMSHVTDACVM